STWRRLTSPRVLERWGLAAAAVMLLIVGGYVLFQNASLRSQLSESRTARSILEERERQLQGQMEERRSADAETARELQRVRESFAELQGRGSVPSIGKPLIASFVLLPATRGPGAVATITVPRASE